MRLLDLFCGLGGWSDGFYQNGFDCTGVDNRVLKYKGEGYRYNFICQDIFDYQPSNYYDVVVASPPCSEFSIAKYYAYGTQKERQGLDLVYRAFDIINKIKPRFYVVENVKHLSDFIGPPSAIIPYNRFASGKKAYLWGQFPEFKINEDINYNANKWGNSHPMRAKIPLQLSNALAKAINLVIQPVKT